MYKVDRAAAAAFYLVLHSVGGLHHGQLLILWLDVAPSEM